MDSIAAAIHLERGYLETIANAVVKPSPIHGRGLFTVSRVAAGAVLTRLDGQRVSIEEVPAAMDAFEWNAVSKSILLVRPIRTSYGFLNHSREPNVRIDPDTMDLILLETVPADTELLIDYLDQPLPDAYLALPRAEYLRR